MTKQELWEHNVAEIEKLSTSAGSVIRAVILTCKRNGDVYIKVTAANADNKVNYELLEGDENILQQVCDHFGVERKDGVLAV